MVLKLNFKGLIAPVFTPFSRQTGDVNISIIKPYAQYLINSGVNGVLVNGTVGEGVCMSVQERKTVLEAWLEVLKGTSLHVMVHIGGPCLRDVQDLARHAESKGVSSLLCIPDLFHRPSNVEEAITFLSLVSEAAPNTPLLYYHIPASTGVHCEYSHFVDMAELLKVAERKVPTMSGIKFTHNNMDEASQCLEVNSENLSVLLGHDQLISTGFFVGFESLIATTLNMFAPLIIEIHQGVKDSKINLVRAKQKQLTTYVNTIIKYGKWVPAMKEAMLIVTGLDMGAARQPQGVVTPEQVKQLKADLSSLNVMK
uniref:N-acetylneuraminate lyase n=1 Tax=Homalodisca liturata TaxID=320908 RepID=A0A1B6I5W9_9HEMI